jgi:hypothetical protein
MTALLAPAAQHVAAARSPHPDPEAVSFRPPPAVGLESSLQKPVLP